MLSIMTATFSALLWLTVMTASAYGAEAPLRVLIDVRTHHSDGSHSMDELVRMARARGIDAIVFTEHDRTGIRLGIEPLGGIIGHTKEMPSLYTTGVDVFFSDLKHIRKAFPDMLFLAGTESTPGYHWTGLPFANWTLHDAERHIITMGVENARQVEALPSYDLRHARGSLSLSLVTWACAALLAFFLLTMNKRKAGLILLAVALPLAGIAWWGSDGVDQDADFLAKAGAQGLYTIWTHPGTLSGVRKGPMGVQLNSRPYSERVFRDPTADAFAAVYGDSDSNTEAGGLWDRYLMDYLRGRHPKPIWGVAAGDFHTQGEANEHLGNFPMDVWTRDRTPLGVLEAMKSGRMVAWGLPKNRNLYMRGLWLADGIGGRLLPGSKVKTDTQIILYAEMAEHGNGKKGRQRFRSEIIVDGQVVARPWMEIGTPVRETILLAPGPHVIRLRIPVQEAIRMEANPFFVRAGG